MQSRSWVVAVINLTHPAHRKSTATSNCHPDSIHILKTTFPRAQRLQNDDSFSSIVCHINRGRPVMKSQATLNKSRKMLERKNALGRRVICRSVTRLGVSGNQVYVLYPEVNKGNENVQLWACQRVQTSSVPF